MSKSKNKNQYKSDPENAFSGPDRASTQEAKIAELERVIGRLYLENDFLKKTIEHREKMQQRQKELL